MHHGNLQHEGAWSFGTAKRGFEKDVSNEVPGPGTHDLPVRKSSPTWTLSKASRSLPTKQKGVPVGNYNPQQHYTQPTPYSSKIGSSTRPDPGNSKLTKDIDCYPSQQLTRSTVPSYTMGWKNDESACNGNPSPSQYFSTIVTSPKRTNRSDIALTTSERTDFTQGNVNPAVGTYEVQTSSLSPEISFTKGRRMDRVGNGYPEPGAYRVSGNMYRPGLGKTFGDKLPQLANKDDYPSPNKYLPALPKHKGSIFMYQSNRPSPTNKDAVMTPSPVAYNVEGRLDKQVHFGKGLRADIAPPRLGPGPGTYDLSDPRNTLFGKINSPSIMSPSSKPVGNPAPWAYSPKLTLIQRKGSDSLIGLTGNRQDFSKSPTKALGPGAYELKKNFSKQLGKFGLSQRLPPKKQDNPGPGQYNFPPSLGRIPKYYHSLNRKIGQHGEVKHVKYDPKATAQAKLESILNGSAQKA